MHRCVSYKYSNDVSCEFDEFRVDSHLLSLQAAYNIDLPFVSFIIKT